MTVGERIRHARAKKEWDQEDLAREVGVSQATVSGWENGVTPRPNRLRKLAHVLGVRLTDLIPEDDAA